MVMTSMNTGATDVNKQDGTKEVSINGTGITKKKKTSNM